MPKFLRNILATLSLTAACLLSSAAWALPYSNLYVFGDSLADSGNNAAFFDAYLGGVRTPVPLPGPIIPEAPYSSSDRYSNGPVWVEYLAANLGLSAAPSLLGGTNYAFGGARTGPASGFPYSMLDQVNMFLGDHGNVASTTALYVIEGGGNDARDVFMAALGGGNPNVLIEAYAANIATMLVQLSLAGADQFLLWNVPDIGKIPAIAALGSGASGVASGLVAAMNDALQLALANLAPEVTDGLHLFDVYGAVNDLGGDPLAYGFNDIGHACGMDAACIANPDGYFFWDGIHPTTAGHQIMAQLAQAELPEPATLILLLIALAAMSLVRHRTA